MQRGDVESAFYMPYNRCVGDCDQFTPYYTTFHHTFVFVASLLSREDQSRCLMEERVARWRYPMEERAGWKCLPEAVVLELMGEIVVD